MTAYAGVLDWAATRPWWQQQAIVKLASGAEYTDEDYAELVEALLKEPPSHPLPGGSMGFSSLLRLLLRR